VGIPVSCVTPETILWITLATLEIWLDNTPLSRVSCATLDVILWIMLDTSPDRTDVFVRIALSRLVWLSNSPVETAVSWAALEMTLSTILERPPVEMEV
jgi:hypothetical protein